MKTTKVKIGIYKIEVNNQYFYAKKSDYRNEWTIYQPCTKYIDEYINNEDVNWVDAPYKLKTLKNCKDVVATFS